MDKAQRRLEDNIGVCGCGYVYGCVLYYLSNENFVIFFVSFARNLSRGIQITWSF